MQFLLNHHVATPIPHDEAAKRRRDFMKRRSSSFTDLEEQFALLIPELVEALETCEKVLQRMKLAMKSLDWRNKPEFRHISSDSFKSATDVKEFIEAIEPTCLDCELLRIAVKASKCNEAITAMEEYLALKDLVDIPITEDGTVATRVASNRQCQCSRVRVISQRGSMNGNQYEKITNMLSKLWESPRAALRFLWCTKGSFKVYWRVHPSLVAHITSLPITGQNLKELAELQVTEVTLDESYKLSVPSLPPEADVCNITFIKLSL